jgi:hypothetical protein
MAKVNVLSALRKVPKLVTIGRRRRLLLAEAIVRLLIASLSLRLFPFRRISREFGFFVSPSDRRARLCSRGESEGEAECAGDIGWAVRAAAPLMPFRSVCLHQAIAAQAMLRKRGVATVMHFGAGKGDVDPLGAHAWLDAAGVKVTGYPVAPQFQEIGCFVSGFPETAGVPDPKELSS